MPSESIVKVKQLFLDRPAITRYIDRKTQRVFKRFGAFVRLVAQRSMRRRKTASPPGQPPSVHKGQLRKLIFFSLDERRKSVVIGPILLSPDSPVPALHEHSGTRRYGARIAKYPKREYMNPAFREGLSRLSQFYKEANS
jgi:hypothetical protein